jgi:hypothetical protein
MNANLYCLYCPQNFLFLTVGIKNSEFFILCLKCNENVLSSETGYFNVEYDLCVCVLP